MTLIPYAGKDPCDIPFSVASKFGPQVSIARAKSIAKVLEKFQPLSAAQKEARAAFAKREAIRVRILSIFRKRGMPVWARQMVEQAANRHCVGIEFLAVDYRGRRVVHARNEAIYLIKAHSPDLSAPVIGRWFAKDHTSILHSLASHADRTGDPPLSTYDLNKMRRRAVAFSAWKRKQSKERAAA